MNVTKELYSKKMRSTMQRAVGSLVFMKHGKVTYVMTIVDTNEFLFRVYDVLGYENVDDATITLEEKIFTFDSSLKTVPSLIEDMISQIEMYLIT